MCHPCVHKRVANQPICRFFSLSSSTVFTWWHLFQFLTSFALDLFRPRSLCSPSTSGHHQLDFDWSSFGARDEYNKPNQPWIDSSAVGRLTGNIVGPQEGGEVMRNFGDRGSSEGRTLEGNCDAVGHGPKFNISMQQLTWVAGGSALLIARPRC